MANQQSSRADRDESLELQNEVDHQAGVGAGLGDRSASGLNTPGRTGLGGGVNADDLRMATSGATDPSLDENESSYADGDAPGPRRVPNPDRDTTDGPAPKDGADRGLEEGDADSKGKADFMNMESEDDNKKK